MNPLFKRLLIGKNLRRTLIRTAILVALTTLTLRYVIAPLRLDGRSMEPTYTHGQFTIANRLAYLNGAPQRGDIIAVRIRDSGRSVFLLKRVVGLPGEWIGFKNGQLTIDGTPQPENYLIYKSDWDREPVACEANEYFIVGDNRSMPMEQHTFGRTTQSRIVGKVIF